MRATIPEIDLEKCNGCGDCIEWCFTGAVKLENNKAVVVKPEDCHYCTDCESICPAGAISCPFEIILVKAESKPASDQQ